MLSGEDRSIRLRRARSFYNLDSNSRIRHHEGLTDQADGPSSSSSSSISLSVSPSVASEKLAARDRVAHALASVSSSRSVVRRPSETAECGQNAMLSAVWSSSSSSSSAISRPLIDRRIEELPLLSHSRSDTDLTATPLSSNWKTRPSQERAPHLRSKRHPSDLGFGDLAVKNKDAPVNCSSKAKVIVHLVQTTDTLAGLSLRYGISIPSLKKANRLWTNDSVQARKEIYLPVSDCHRLREEDLARKVGLIKIDQSDSEEGNSEVTWTKSGDNDPLSIVPESLEDRLKQEQNQAEALMKASETLEPPLIRVESLPTEHLSYFPPARRKAREVEPRRSMSSLRYEAGRDGSAPLEPYHEFRSTPSSPRRTNAASWEEWLGLVHSDAEISSESGQQKRSPSVTSGHWNMPLGSSHYLRAARNALGHSLAGRLSLDAVRVSFDREYRKSLEQAQEKRSERYGKMELKETFSVERSQPRANKGGTLPTQVSSGNANAFQQFGDYHR